MKLKSLLNLKYYNEISTAIIVTVYWRHLLSSSIWYIIKNMQNMIPLSFFSVLAGVLLNMLYHSALVHMNPINPMSIIVNKIITRVLLSILLIKIYVILKY